MAPRGAFSFLDAPEEMGARAELNEHFTSGSGDFNAGPEGAPDGHLDLVCHFITMDIVPEAGATTATISGELNDTMPIVGTDSVNIVP